MPALRLWARRLLVGCALACSAPAWAQAVDEPLHSDWLYLAVEPVVRWERRYGWRADPGLRLGLYALFWGLSR